MAGNIFATCAADTTCRVYDLEASSAPVVLQGSGSVRKCALNKTNVDLCGLLDSEGAKLYSRKSQEPVAEIYMEEDVVYQDASNTNKGIDLALNG